jgi:hypothetical protein
VSPLLLAALAATPSSAGEEASPAAPADEEVSWYLIPNVGVDTDDGLGFGGRFELAVLHPDYAPYKVSWVLQGYATLRGYQHHRLRWDRVGLGREGRLRATAHLAWRQWLNDGYWGIGNGTTRDRAAVESGDRTVYRYTLIQPFAYSTLRWTVGGPWSVYGALTGKWSEVRTYEGSRLEAEQPFGVDGGLSLQLAGGVLYDSRSPEVDPDRGALVELSGRANPPQPLVDGVFAGALLSAAGFASPLPRLTVAGRLMGEQLWGQVPFYEMVTWGGLSPVLGVGGWQTVRGVSFGRWHAPGKAVANLELRARVLHHTLLGDPAEWQLVPYLDAAAVFGAGEDATAPAPEQPLHPAAGAGLRLVYDENFVARVDVGVGLDPVLEQDGTITQEPTPGFYLAFDHIF